MRDGKVRVVSNDLSGNGRLLIEDLGGSDMVDMCWASASALVHPLPLKYNRLLVLF